MKEHQTRKMGTSLHWENGKMGMGQWDSGDSGFRMFGSPCNHKNTFIYQSYSCSPPPPFTVPQSQMV